MKAPLFSIVIPVYNVAQYLPRCLDSILSQDFGEWEAVCVDDGSSDGSGAILDAYARRDSRIHVVHQSNRGVSAARRVGLSNAQGDWIAWVDSDDYVEKDFLATFVDRINKESCDIVWTGYTLDNGLTTERKRQEASGKIQLHARALLEEKIWGTLWSRSFRREFLQRNEVSFDNLQIGFQEDLCFVLQCLKHGPTLAYAEGYAYHYCQRNGSALHGGARHGASAVVALQALIEDSVAQFGVDDLLVTRRKWVKLSLLKHLREVGVGRFVRYHPEIRHVNDLPVSIVVKLVFWLINRLLSST